MNSSNILNLLQDTFFKLGLPFSIFNAISNTLCLIIFMHKKFRSTSTGFYLNFLTVTDLLQSYMTIGYYVQEFNIQIDTVSSIFCKLHNYLIYTLPLLPGWVLVIISVDQFISITFVQYAPILNKLQTKISLVTCVMLFICLLNSVDFFFFRLEFVNNSSVRTCFVPREFLAISTNLIIYSCLIASTMLPLLVMTTANILATNKLMNSKKAMIMNKSPMKKEIKFEATIIGLNLLFIIFSVPVCVFMLMTQQQNYDENYYFTYFALVFFRHSHSCLQFFVYLCANRIFRSEFVMLTRLFARVNLVKLQSFKNISTIGTFKQSSEEIKVTHKPRDNDKNKKLLKIMDPNLSLLKDETHIKVIYFF